MKQLKLPNIVRKPPLSRLERVLQYAEKKGGYDIQFASGYSEPGYDDKPIALSNWNDKTWWDKEKNKIVVVNTIMPRVARILEKMGYAIEWEDEWHICDECGKAVKSNGDSYGWKQYYWINKYGIICGDCVKKNPGDYLAYLSGNEKACLTLDIDLTKYGYVKVNENYENGLYGVNDNPKDISEKLHKQGITDFIFVLDKVNQFLIGFSVWAKQKKENE